MSLTFGGGPLSKNAPGTVNYTLDGPAHALFMQPFPRRVRAVLGGTTVLDTENAVFVHETSLLPQLYVPTEALRASALTPSSTTTHCPYKGDASYWHLSIGDTTVDDAVWSYPDPRPEAHWLRGLSALYMEAPDTWYDEEEEIRAHFRDPYHRVDTRPSSNIVRVRSGGEVLALSTAAKVVSETGLHNRYYLPLQDVRDGVLVPSETVYHCPYKGQARYWNVVAGGTEITDAAWAYTVPLSDGRDITDHVCFRHDSIETDLERR
ncbi:DUF427 domain-containing protein [Nocardiopsis coralliicola]